MDPHLRICENEPEGRELALDSDARLLHETVVVPPIEIVEEQVGEIVIEMTVEPRHHLIDRHWWWWWWWWWRWCDICMRGKKIEMIKKKKRKKIIIIPGIERIDLGQTRLWLYLLGRFRKPSRTVL